MRRKTSTGFTVVRSRTFDVMDHGAIGDGAHPTEDSAAAVAAYARCTRRGDEVVFSEPPVRYDITGNPLASLGRSNGCETHIEGDVRIYNQWIAPDGHMIDGTGRRLNSPTEYGGKLEAASTFTVPADRLMVRLGPNDDNYASRSKIRDLLLSSVSLTNGLIAVGGHRLQEQSGLERVSMQGFRKAANFYYAATAGNGRNANFHILDCELNNLAESATTLASPAVLNDTTVTLSSVADAPFQGDFIAILLDSAAWHIAHIENVAGAVVTIYPAMTGAAAALNTVKHTSVSADVWCGGGLLMQRNTVFPYLSPAGATLPIAPCVRFAGTGNNVISVLHGESSMAALLLGGWTENMTDAFYSTAGLLVEGVDNNSHSITGCDVVRIADRDRTALSYQHRVSDVALRNFNSKTSCLNLVRDEGSVGTGGAGREAFTLDVATYGSYSATPYIIGTAYPGSAYGPRSFVGTQEGRRNVTVASGNTDDFDPTYGKYFRITPNADGTSAIRNILGYRFGRELYFTNLAAIGSGDNLGFPANVGGTDAASRIFPIDSTGALINFSLLPQQTCRLVYGVGPQAARWTIALVG